MKTVMIQKNDQLLLRRALAYAKPYAFKLIIAFIFIVSGIGFGLIQPLIWAKVIVYLFSKQYTQISSLIIWLIVLYVTQTIIGLAQSYLFVHLNENLIFDLKRDLYQKILNLPVKAFDELPTGEFISRLHGDASIVANVITNDFLNTIVDLLRVVIVGFVIFCINAPLATIVLLAFPISSYITILFRKRIREAHSALAKANDGYFSNIQQSITGIREIKSLGIERNRLDSFQKAARQVKTKNVATSVLGSFALTSSQMLNFIAQVVVIAVGAYLISRDALTVELFIVFNSYSGQFSNSLMNLTRFNTNLQRVLTSLERIFGVMDNLNYSREKFGIKHDSIQGKIRFENVTFYYKENIPILKEISFEINENRKTAIVGMSGSGKTTIFNLLQRFYEPVAGKINIDEVNIDDFDEDWLRSQLSVVRQEPFLFNLSIIENLRLAKPSASDEEIMKVCRAAYIHDYICSLPNGYDSVVGNNGVNLSVGQKQRIAIARVLLKDSRVILFDEATSALDNESQYHIQKVFDELSKDHTVLIIAHNLFTVIGADEIIVIENGIISGHGSHQTLIETNETYRRLYHNELETLQNNREVAL